MNKSKDKKVESAEKQIYTHESVMVDEVLSNLDASRRRNVVDATLGLGGHARALLEKMPKTGKIIGFDADPEHIRMAKKKLRSFSSRVTFIHNNFAYLQDELKKLRVKVFDGFLFDLGLASPHVDNPERGFSFLREGPLDMRFNPKQVVTAADVVNKYSEKELVRIFQEYGEEKKARRIAREIVKSRKRKPFRTTTQLAKFVEKHVKRAGRIHPATRVFQALRMEVNQELEVLDSALKQAVQILKPGGRIAVISYHSLEDRIVKNLFRDFSRGDKSVLTLVTKKPLVPLNEEVAQNPRSRSAKLRVAQKI